MAGYRRWYTLGGGLIGVLLLGVAGFNFIRCYCGAQVRLTLSGGSICPLRAEMAQRIADSISGNVQVEVRRGATSRDVCEAVESGELDLGLVLSGLPTAEFGNVCQVATLGVDPLHLLVRTELIAEIADSADSTTAAAARPTLEILRGRRVALGEQGSNGARLTEDLLRLAGLRATSPTKPGEFIADYSTEVELAAQLAAWRAASKDKQAALAEQLPDAVFLLDALPSELVDRFVRTGDYQLVPLPFATALHVDSRREHSATVEQLRNDRVEAISIPAFAYGIQPAMPATDCPTIGLRLLLVANKHVPKKALLGALRSLSDAAEMHGRVAVDATNANPEFPIHPGAEAFLRARRPINVGEILGPATDALSVFGATIAGGFALWGFVRGFRAVHPDVHLRQVDRIERLLQGDERDEAAPTLPAEFVEYLELRLTRVKQAAIEDYVAGRLDGDDALVGIFTLIADTRHLLAQRRKQVAAGEAPAAPRLARLHAA